MYKKLMFLISLVALLALVNIAPADDIEWDGDTDCSWHDADNWDPDQLPGTGDRAVVLVPDPPGASFDTQYQCPVMTSDVTVLEFAGPAFEQQEDVNQLMTIDGATFTITSAEQEDNWVRDGDFGGDDAETSYWEIRLINGARMQIPNGGARLFDHGMGRLSLEDDSSFYVNGQFRAADEDDGYMWVVTTGTSTIDIAEDCFLGDDGGGNFDFGGNSTVTVGDWFGIPGRKEDILGMTSQINVRDSAVLTAAGIGVHADEEGTVLMNVYDSATVNAGFLRAGCKVCKDESPEGTGEIYVDGGTVNICGDISIPDSEDTTALLEQTGGAINACTLVVKDNGTVNLIGGVLTVGSVPDCGSCSSGLEMEGGVMDISGGTLILTGDQCELVADLAASGLIGAYYTDAGGGCVGFKGTINCDFDGENTTVTGNPANPYKPWAPTPADNSDEHPVGVVLCFCDGDYAFRNSLYLGTDPVAVENAGLTDPESKGYYEPGECLDPDLALKNPITLQLWTTYYWRADVIHSPTSPPGTPTTTKGDVWSFTTGCELFPGDINLDCVVNSLDYGMMADDWREEVWFPEDVQP
ncbi:MAG: hypothetical protein ACYS21_04680 [Planctomycetota bacterium]|jgi:hypothetical protein